jgi:hypothetical protein
VSESGPLGDFFICSQHSRDILWCPLNWDIENAMKWFNPQHRDLSLHLCPPLLTLPQLTHEMSPLVMLMNLALVLRVWSVPTESHSLQKKLAAVN